MEINRLKSSLRKLFSLFLVAFINYHIIAEDYFSKLKDIKWVLSEYFVILKSEDRYNLIDIWPNAEEYYYHEFSNGDIQTWKESAELLLDIKFRLGKDFVAENTEDFTIDDKLILIGDWNTYTFVIKKEKLSENNGKVLYECLSKTVTTPDTESFLIKFPTIRKGEYYNLKFILDGDYLSLYIDDRFIHRFCHIDEETKKHYKNLINNGECDLSKVSWPHYADGTSDYDDKIIIPEPIISEETVIKLNTQQNDTKLSILKEQNNNKIEPIIKDVKNIQQGIINQKFGIYMRPKGLQISEINPVAKVKIIEIGPEDTIGNIKSNWVKIKITNKVLDSRNENCKGATGWIFGGCLN